MEIRKIILEIIDEFQLANNIPDTTLGLLALGDGHFVKSIRDGKKVTVARCERLLKFIKNYHIDGTSHELN